MMIRRLAIRILKKTQKLNDKLYEKEGLTDKVLTNQLRINAIKEAYNLFDDEYVQ